MVVFFFLFLKFYFTLYDSIIENHEPMCVIKKFLEISMIQIFFLIIYSEKLLHFSLCIFIILALCLMKLQEELVFESLQLGIVLLGPYLKFILLLRLLMLYTTLGVENFVRGRR